MNDRPLLYVLGDSLSIGYGPDLKRFVEPRWRYNRKGGLGATLDDPIHASGPNGGDSRMCLEHLRAYQASKLPRPAVLLLNCGLHDIKQPPGSTQNQVPIDEYRRNLQTIVECVREWGPRLIWIRITPIDDHNHNVVHAIEWRRHNADVDRYNVVADAVMNAAGVPMIDLHACCRSMENPFYDHAHYHPPLAAQQAAFIAGWLSHEYPTICS